MIWFPLVSTGSVFWLDTPLPGEPSGGHHMTAVISSDEYSSATGMPVTAALRASKPNAYRIRVWPNEFRSAPYGVPLDHARVIGLDQACGVPESRLTDIAGDLDPPVLERVRQAIPKQYQLEGPWQRRGEIWEVDVSDGSATTVVLAMNDVALGHPAQQQCTSLPFQGGEISLCPFLLLGRDQLRTRVGQLDETGQQALNQIIVYMFGLKEAC